MLNATPLIGDDLHLTTPINTTLVRNTVATGLLANDFDPEGSPLNASKVSDPGNGSVTLYADGTFNYSPNTGFVGVDSFLYTVGDGSSSSRVGKVQITVGTGLAGAQNLNERISDNVLHAGGLTQSQPLSDGMRLVFRSDLQGTAIVPIETFFTPGTVIPNTVTAQLTFGGFAQGSVVYSKAISPTFTNSDVLRFAIQARSYPSAFLGTGMYIWQMTLTSDYGGSQPNEVRVFSGSQALVNRVASDFGPGWWMDGVDRLHIQNGMSNRPDGILLLEGDGTTLWFAKNGSQWNRAEGDLTFSDLTQNGSGYRLKDKWGNEKLFDSDGYLQSMRYVNNVAPVYRYFYDSSTPRKLTSIQDEYNRVFPVTYQPSGSVFLRFGSFSGTRQTDFTPPVTQPNGDITWSVTQNIHQGGNPVGLPPYYNPVWNYTSRLTFGQYLPGSRTAPSESSGPQSLTTYEFDEFGLLTNMTLRNINADGMGIDGMALEPMLKFGLYDAYNPATPNKFVIAGNLGGSYSGFGQSNLQFRSERFGNVVRSSDYQGATTVNEFDSYGLMFRVTGADPDGAGAQLSPITIYGYNILGDLLLLRNPDHTPSVPSERKWVYDPVLHLPTSESNELNQTTTFLYDAVGNLTRRTDAQGNQWNFVYDQSTKPANDRHGRLEQMISPDPDGAGPLLSITTSWEYQTGIYMLVKKITNGDGTTQEYTYTLTDQVATVKDELLRQTDYFWDDMDRLVLVVQPAPNISSIRPEWRFNYGQSGQLLSETDPLNHTTTYQYDGQYQLIRKILHDPDGAGPLTRPEYKWSWAGIGRVSKYTDPTYAAGLEDKFYYDQNGNLNLAYGPLHNQYLAQSSSQETQYFYDFRNRLTKVVDASGRTMQREYDIRDRLVKSMDHDPDGTGPQLPPTVTYGYDRADRLTSVRDELYRQTDYIYTANGWLQNVILPDPDLTGSLTRPNYVFSYDTLGRRTQATDPLSRVTITAYDSMHRVIQVTLPDPDAGGPAASPNYFYQYDAVGNLKVVTQPMVRVTSFNYDNLNRTIKVTLPDPDGAGVGQPSPEWQYQYDLVGNLTQQTDPLGRITGFQYDNLYRRTQLTQPDPNVIGGSGGPVWQYNYGQNTLLASVTDPLTHKTSYTYDNGGRTSLVTLPDPDGTGTAYTSSIYSYHYDQLNRLSYVVEPDPDGSGPLTSSQTGYQYDIRSRLQQVTDARGGVTAYGWNDANELIRLTDSVGNKTEWAYDRLGRRTLETNSLGLTRSSEYDSAGNLIRSTDRNGRIIKYALDNLDRLQTESWHTVAGTAPEVSVSTTTQGGSGQNEVQSVQFTQLSSGNTGTFTLGFDGETTRSIAWNASAATVKSALEELIGIDTVTVTLTLTGATRTYTVTFTGGHAGKNVPQLHGAGRLDVDPSANRTLSWFYDSASRLIAVSDPTAIYQYTLDKLDRVTSEIQNSAAIGLVPQVRMNHSYDLVGNRTGLSAEFVVGAAVTKDFTNAYTFDKLNRVTRITQTSQGSGAGFDAVADKRVDLWYNALGQFTFINRYQTLTESGNVKLRSIFQYDEANRQTIVYHRGYDATNQYTDFNWYQNTYDRMNRLTKIVTLQDGISNYQYDQTSQLTSADHAPARPDENFQYDLNGNRTGGQNVVSTNNRTDSDGTYSYQYDKEGNRTRRTKISDGKYEDYTFDHRNRLGNVTFRTPGISFFSTVDYSYDMFNRLVKRTVDANGPDPGGSIDQFFAGYDGINPTLEFSRANPGAGGVGIADLKHRYLWGPVVDQLFADEQLTSPTVAGNTLFPIADHLGTVRDIADFNGTTGLFFLANHRTYDSFGNVTAESNGAVDLNFAYTGKFLDDQTGYSLHWNRWLDPKTGKWISEDPIGFLGGDANLERYVGNIAVRRSDPSGLIRQEEVALDWYERLSVAQVENAVESGVGYHQQGSVGIFVEVDGRIMLAVYHYQPARRIQRFDKADFLHYDYLPYSADFLELIPGTATGAVGPDLEAEANQLYAEANITLYGGLLSIASFGYGLWAAGPTLGIRGIALAGTGEIVSQTTGLPVGMLDPGDLLKSGKTLAPKGPSLRGDVALSGGRSGQHVKNLVGPPNSAVRGGGDRIFMTNDKGQVILDITRDRVKPVTPGQGFGPKRPPTPDELSLLEQMLGGG